MHWGGLERRGRRHPGKAQWLLFPGLLPVNWQSEALRQKENTLGGNKRGERIRKTGGKLQKPTTAWGGRQDILHYSHFSVRKLRPGNKLETHPGLAQFQPVSLHSSGLTHS